MGAFPQNWRRSNWIPLGCLIGLAAYLGCEAKSPEAAPAQAEHVGESQFMADGARFLAEGKLTEAVAVFNKEIAAHPKNAEAFFDRADARQRQQQPDEAIADYTAAVILDPTNAAAFYRRGALYLAKGFPKIAIDDLSDAIRLDPKSPDAARLRARAWLTEERYAEAVKDACLAIRLQANCSDAFRTLGESFLHSPDEQPDSAVECFEEAIRLDEKLATEVNPELAQAYFDWGVRLNKAAAQLKAEKAFSEAIRLAPQFAQPYDEYMAKAHPSGPPDLAIPLQQAFDSLNQGQFDKALGEFSGILRRDDKSAAAWYGRGSAFLEKGFADSAIQDLDRAIKFGPDSAEAYSQRGRAYVKMGDYNQAIADATEAIRLKPDFGPAYFHRAVAYLAKKSLDLALANLDEAVKLDPKLDKAKSTYADIYEGQGVNQIAAQRSREAIASLEKAIDRDNDRAKRIQPLLVQAYGRRGLDYAKHGEFAKAVSDVNKAVELDGSGAQGQRFYGLMSCEWAKNCHDRRLIADEREQWKSAVRHMKRAIWLDPEIEHLLWRPLDEANRNLDAISPPARLVQSAGL